MISKVDFQNISTNFTVDYSYTDIYDWDGGTIETTSDVGILSQEARSVSFTLKYDSFLQSLIDDKTTVLKYKVVAYDGDSVSIFRGFLKTDSSLSIDKNTLMVNVEACDIWTFLKDGGEFQNNSKLTLSTDNVIILGLLSGLKDRITATKIVHTYAIENDLFFVNQGITVDSREYGATNNATGQPYKPPFRCRLKLIGIDGTKYTYGEYSPYIFEIDDEFVLTEENYRIDNGILYYYYISLPAYNLTDVYPSGEYETVDVYEYQYKLDNSEPLLGETLSFEQTYSNISKTTVISTKVKFRMYLDYKSDSDGFSNSIYNYWIYPINAPYEVKRKSYDPIYGTTTYTEYLPTEDDEFLFWTRSKTKDYQQAIFVDWFDYTVYVEIHIHYIVKLWGLWISEFNNDDNDNDKATGYSYRKRIIRINGYQVIYDNFDETFIPEVEDRAILYTTALSRKLNGVLTKEGSVFGNYYLGDHKTTVQTLQGLSDEFTELATLPSDLFNCKYAKVNSGDGPGSTGTYSLDDTFSFINANSDYYNLIFNSTWDNSGSGLSQPSDPYYRNIANITVIYTGKVNLSSYIYSNPFGISDAIKLAMISNMASLISDNANSIIKCVNKVPITNSVSLSSSDIIGLKESNTKEDDFDESIYDVIDFENKDALNTSITTFIDNTLNLFNKQVSFKYSSIFSNIKLSIGDNFDYNGDRFSVCSITEENDFIQSITAIKNGESVLQFKIGGVLSNAQLITVPLGTATDWNIRSV